MATNHTSTATPAGASYTLPDITVSLFAHIDASTGKSLLGANKYSLADRLDILHHACRLAPDAFTAARSRPPAEIVRATNPVFAAVDRASAAEPVPDDADATINGTALKPREFTLDDILRVETAYGSVNTLDFSRVDISVQLCRVVYDLDSAGAPVTFDALMAADPADYYVHVVPQMVNRLLSGLGFERKGSGGNAPPIPGEKN